MKRPALRLGHSHGFARFVRVFLLVLALPSAVLRGEVSESDIFKAFFAILTSTRGWVILFEEPAELADAQHDYVKLCLEHGCRIHTVLKYPTSTGSTMYYLCVAGANVDAFVRKLWAMSNQVVLVE